jgi:alpha-galactosidase
VVLDVANPGAYAYLLERISALVDEVGIAYIKWDHNRDLHVAVSGTTGRAGVHEQTAALYRLLDELRARHPGLEIESCSSGGARIDLGVLQRTDRVWGSDCNDPLERQLIQRWEGLLLPPELIGSHVGDTVSHTTHRAAALGLRTVTALFAHAGLELDVTKCTDDELAALTTWATFYKEVRGLLHSGDVVRADLPGDDVLLHGVVAGDRREALYAYVRLTTSADEQVGRLLLPGLDPGLEYEVTHRPEAGASGGLQKFGAPWFVRGTARATGAVLARVGLPAPRLDPAQAVVLHVRAR